MKTRSHRDYLHLSGAPRNWLRPAMGAHARVVYLALIVSTAIPRRTRIAGGMSVWFAFREEHGKDETSRVRQTEADHPCTRTSAAPWQFHSRLAQSSRMPNEVATLGIR